MAAAAEVRMIMIVAADVAADVRIRIQELRGHLTDAALHLQAVIADVAVDADSDRYG